MFGATVIVTVLSAAALVVGTAIYNRLIALGRRCDQAAADIDVQLKLRHDLVPSLVETVKGYAGHERTALEDVIKARSSALSAAPGPAKLEAEGMLGAALSRLMMLAEAYPELKAEKRFAALQEELAEIEYHVAAARRFLNAAAAEYNTTREQFPSNVIASLFTFPVRDSRSVPQESLQDLQIAPVVRF